MLYIQTSDTITGNKITKRKVAKYNPPRKALLNKNADDNDKFKMSRLINIQVRKDIKTYTYHYLQY